MPTTRHSEPRSVLSACTIMLLLAFACSYYGDDRVAAVPPSGSAFPQPEHEKAPRRIEADVAAVVLDFSRSHTSSVSQPCRGLLRRVLDVLETKPNRHGLIVYVTGTGRGMAPQVIADFVTIDDPSIRHRSTDPFVDRTLVRERQRTARSERLRRAVEELENRCLAASPSESPVFAAVDAAVEAISTFCARRPESCRSRSLYLHSDLADPTVFLPAAAARSRALAPKLAGLRLEACGSRQVTRTVAVGQGHAYEAAWLRLLPGLALAPTCPGAEIGADRR